MKIGTDVFSGEIPKVSSRLIPDKSSQLAVNCDLKSGFLKPTKVKTPEYDVTESDKETIFKWTHNTDNAIGHTVTNVTPATWATVTNGSMLLSTAGNGYEITGIDFTGDTTMANVASTVQAKIRTATGNNDTCVWSTDHFDFNFDENSFVSMGALYGTGTDITDTDYMNVRGDIAVTQTDWITADDFTYYFNSPIVEDQYQRLYSISSETGVYRVRDNNYQFTDTDREMILDVPSPALSVVATDPPVYNDQGESPAVIETNGYAGNGYPSSASFDIRINTVDVGTVKWNIGDSIKWDSASGVYYIYGTISALYAISGTTLDLIVNVTSSRRPTTTLAGSVVIETETIPAGTYYPELDGSTRDGGSIYDRSYVWAYVYENGEESPISLVSDEVKIYPEAQANLTAIGTAAPPTGVVSKNIYCTNVDLWQLCGTIDGTATTFTDNISATALGEEMQVYQNAPSNMDGIVVSSQGFCVGWRGNDLFFSESALPYAWDDRWSLNFSNDVVACVAVSGEIYVLTTGAPYLLTGYHPSELVSNALPINQSCSNKKAVTHIGNQVIYASPDGLISLSGSNVKLMTTDFYTRDEWQNLGPSTMRIASHDDEIYIFTDTETYILSTRYASNGIVRIDEIVDAVYEDVEEDLLYTYNSTSQYISSLRTGSTDATYKWRSKEYDFRRRTHLSCAKVIADDYNDLTLKIYADGNYTAPVSSQPVPNNKTFRLLKGGSYNTCAYQLEGSSVVHSIQIGTNMKELDG